MFFSPEIWREFIKPLEKQYADRIHEHGALYMHHSCGYIMQIIPDLIEIGVDAIEPMMPVNDMDECLEKYGDKITFMGGIDNYIVDVEESTPEQIFAEVKRALDAYSGKGRYLPYYIPSIEQKWFIYMDAVNKLGMEKQSA